MHEVIFLVTSHTLKLEKSEPWDHDYVQELQGDHKIGISFDIFNFLLLVSTIDIQNN